MSISLTDLKDALIDNKILPDYSILITFDDGFRNNLTHAAPLLKKYEIPAAVFLTSGHIGTEKLLWTQETEERHRNLRTPDFSMMSVSELKRLPNADRLKYLEELRQHSELATPQQWQRELYSFLKWNEVRQLSHFGIEIGGHTATHPILSSLSPQEMHRELAESKKKIEQETGEECFAIAY